MKNKRENRREEFSQIQYVQTIPVHEFIREEARNYPVHRCYVNKNWEKSVLTTMYATRQLPSGLLIVGYYIMDKRCEGLLKTFGRVTPAEKFRYALQKDSKEDPFIPCTMDFAASMVYGSLEYAANLGFEPPEEFEDTCLVLPPKEEVQWVPIEFGGVDGKPLYVPLPEYDDHRIKMTLDKLTKKLGPDAFDYYMPYTKTDYSMKKNFEFIQKRSDHIVVKYINFEYLMTELMKEALKEVFPDEFPTYVNAAKAEEFCQEVEKQAMEHILLKRGEVPGDDFRKELRSLSMMMVGNINKKRNA